MFISAPICRLFAVRIDPTAVHGATLVAKRLARRDRATSPSSRNPPTSST